MFTVSVLLTIFFKVCGYTFVTNFFTFQKKNTFGVSAFHLQKIINYWIKIWNCKLILYISA